MNTIKDALLIKEHWPDTEDARVLHRHPGVWKGFRGSIPAGETRRRRLCSWDSRRNHRETSDTGDLTLLGENTLLGTHYRSTMDMVVLSVGIKPHKDASVVQRLLNLSADTDGFLWRPTLNLRPVDTTTGGVFLAGAAEGPKDIKDSVTQASAAASRANILMSKGEVKIPSITANIDPAKCTACGFVRQSLPVPRHRRKQGTGYYT